MRFIPVFTVSKRGGDVTDVGLDFIKVTVGPIGLGSTVLVIKFSTAMLDSSVAAPLAGSIRSWIPPKDGWVALAGESPFNLGALGLVKVDGTSVSLMAFLSIAFAKRGKKSWYAAFALALVLFLCLRCRLRSLLLHGGGGADNASDLEGTKAAGLAIDLVTGLSMQVVYPVDAPAFSLVTSVRSEPVVAGWRCPLFG